MIARCALLRSVAVRFRLWLATALALCAIVGSVLHAQLSQDEKNQRDESTNNQDQGRAASSPVPKKSPGRVAKRKAVANKSKKKPRHSPTPEESPSPIPKAKRAGEKASKTAASETAKESPSPIKRAKRVTEDSTSETAGSPLPEESPHPTAKPKLRQKSGEDDEQATKPRPSETPEATASSQKRKKSVRPTPKPKTGKKKSRKKETSSERKKAARAKAQAKEQEATRPEKTPKPHLEPSPASSETATPPPPHAVAVPTPAVSPESKIRRALPADERAQVVIEKSGLEEDQGFEPPPSPPPRRFGFWPWSRRSPNYRYLTRSVIEAIRRAPVKRRRWQFIIVHNSGTRQGNARVFDYYHRHVRRMQNGLAYHFVIGNGTSTGNGQIEVGDRWRRQINGGHVHSDYLNNISLGICLVGDFNRDQPTRAQLDSCEELIRYLRERCGRTERGEIPVRPHREMNPPRWPTDCPGDVFPYSWFRRF